MPRTLIVSAWYYPFIHPRAHRWTSLAAHWTAQGHEVHVVCARRRDCPDESELDGVRVHRVGYDSLKELVYYLLGVKAGRGRVGAGVRRPGWGIRCLSWLYEVIWKRIYFPDDAMLWFYPARRKVKQLLSEQKFDRIISVSLPFTGHLIGWSAKREFPVVQWLADIGDPFTIQAKPLNNPFLYGRISRYLEKGVLEKADAVVATNVAAVHAYRRMFGAVAEKIRVIPPLLHPPAQHGAAQGVVRNEPDAEIHIGYFGALYAPVRTPDALLELLKQIFSVCPELEKRLQVHFFGDVFPEFYNRLRQNRNVRLHGLHSRLEARAAMNDMDFLINIGNTTDFQLPSKSVEYLAAGKPVVHLSYVDADPFLAFWQDAPGLLALPVERGGFLEADVQRFLSFLEIPPATLTGQALGKRLRPFTLAEVAEAYDTCFAAAAAPRSASGIAEAPVCR